MRVSEVILLVFSTLVLIYYIIRTYKKGGK